MANKRNMNGEEAVNWIKYHIGITDYSEDDELLQAFMTAIDAIECISSLKDRPCEACKHHKESGCCKWECIFDKML